MSTITKDLATIKTIKLEYLHQYYIDYALILKIRISVGNSFIFLK